MYERVQIIYNNLNYYAVLGLEPKKGMNSTDDGAYEHLSPKVIKHAYHKMCKIWHTDKWAKAKYSDDDRFAAEDKFKEVAEAYGVLSDEQQRRHYIVPQGAGQHLIIRAGVIADHAYIPDVREVALYDPSIQSDDIDLTQLLANAAYSFSDLQLNDNIDLVLAFLQHPVPQFSTENNYELMLIAMSHFVDAEAAPWLEMASVQQLLKNLNTRSSAIAFLGACLVRKDLATSCFSVEKYQIICLEHMPEEQMRSLVWHFPELMMCTLKTVASQIAFDEWIEILGKAPNAAQLILIYQKCYVHGALLQSTYERVTTIVKGIGDLFHQDRYEEDFSAAILQVHRLLDTVMVAAGNDKASEVISAVTKQNERDNEPLFTALIHLCWMISHEGGNPHINARDTMENLKIVFRLITALMCKPKTEFRSKIIICTFSHLNIDHIVNFFNSNFNHILPRPFDDLILRLHKFIDADRCNYDLLSYDALKAIVLACDTPERDREGDGLFKSYFLTLCYRQSRMALSRLEVNIFFLRIALTNIEFITQVVADNQPLLAILNQYIFDLDRDHQLTDLLRTIPGYPTEVLDGVELLRHPLPIVVPTEAKLPERVRNGEFADLLDLDDLPPVVLAELLNRVFELSEQNPDKMRALMLSRQGRLSHILISFLSSAPDALFSQFTTQCNQQAGANHILFALDFCVRKFAQGELKVGSINTPDVFLIFNKLIRLATPWCEQFLNGGLLPQLHDFAADEDLSVLTVLFHRDVVKFASHLIENIGGGDLVSFVAGLEFRKAATFIPAIPAIGRLFEPLENNQPLTREHLSDITTVCSAFDDIGYPSASHQYFVLINTHYFQQKLSVYQELVRLINVGVPDVDSKEPDVDSRQVASLLKSIGIDRTVIAMLESTLRQVNPQILVEIVELVIDDSEIAPHIRSLLERTLHHCNTSNDDRAHHSSFEPPSGDPRHRRDSPHRNRNDDSAHFSSRGNSPDHIAFRKYLAKYRSMMTGKMLIELAKKYETAVDIYDELEDASLLKMYLSALFLEETLQGKNTYAAIEYDPAYVAREFIRFVRARLITNMTCAASLKDVALTTTIQRRFLLVPHDIHNVEVRRQIALFSNILNFRDAQPTIVSSKCVGSEDAESAETTAALCIKTKGKLKAAIESQKKKLEAAIKVEDYKSCVKLKKNKDALMAALAEWEKNEGRDQKDEEKSMDNGADVFKGSSTTAFNFVVLLALNGWQPAQERCALYLSNSITKNALLNQFSNVRFVQLLVNLFAEEKFPLKRTLRDRSAEKFAAMFLQTAIIDQLRVAIEERDQKLVGVVVKHFAQLLDWSLKNFNDIGKGAIALELLRALFDVCEPNSDDLKHLVNLHHDLIVRDDILVFFIDELHLAVRNLDTNLREELITRYWNLKGIGEGIAQRSLRLVAGGHVELREFVDAIRTVEVLTAFPFLIDVICNSFLRFTAIEAIPLARLQTLQWAFEVFGGAPRSFGVGSYNGVDNGFPVQLCEFITEGNFFRTFEDYFKNLILTQKLSIADFDRMPPALTDQLTEVIIMPWLQGDQHRQLIDGVYSGRALLQFAMANLNEPVINAMVVNLVEHDNFDITLLPEELRDQVIARYIAEKPVDGDFDFDYIKPLICLVSAKRVNLQTLVQSPKTVAQLIRYPFLVKLIAGRYLEFDQIADIAADRLKLLSARFFHQDSPYPLLADGVRYRCKVKITDYLLNRDDSTSELVIKYLLNQHGIAIGDNDNMEYYNVVINDEVAFAIYRKIFFDAGWAEYGARITDLTEVTYINQVIAVVRDKVLAPIDVARARLEPTRLRDRVSREKCNALDAGKIVLVDAMADVVSSRHSIGNRQEQPDANPMFEAKLWNDLHEGASGLASGAVLNQKRGHVAYVVVAQVFKSVAAALVVLISAVGLFVPLYLGRTQFKRTFFNSATTNAMERVCDDIKEIDDIRDIVERSQMLC